MTAKDSLTLEERRNELLRRSAELRVRVLAGSQALQPALGMADRARAGVQAVRERPLLLAAGAAVAGFLLTRPGVPRKVLAAAVPAVQLVGQLYPLLREHNPMDPP